MDDPDGFPASLRRAYDRYFRSPGTDGVELVEVSEALDADIGAERPGLDGDVLYSHVRPASLAALAAVYAESADTARLEAAGGSARWEHRQVLTGAKDIYNPTLRGEPMG